MFLLHGTKFQTFFLILTFLEAEKFIKRRWALNGGGELLFRLMNIKNGLREMKIRKVLLTLWQN